jgi:hypothetical protein
VSAEHDINAVLGLLAPRGRYVMVGLPGKKPTLNHFAVVNRCWVFSGSTIGNTGMAQDMLNFCGEKGITAEVEVSRAAASVGCCWVQRAWTSHSTVSCWDAWFEGKCGFLQLFMPFFTCMCSMSAQVVHVGCCQ